MTQRTMLGEVNFGLRNFHLLLDDAGMKKPKALQCS